MALRELRAMTSGRAVLALLGFGAWVVGAAVAPSGVWRALLLAPLLIVPVLLGTKEKRWPHVDALALAAAVPLVPAMALAPGVGAALLAVPWFCVCATVAIVALLDGLRAMPTVLAPGRASDLGQLVARGFLAVGAFFVVMDRAGMALGFDQQTILLTAVHFHFAGFGLLTIGSLLAQRTPALWLPVYGLIGAIPLTALGWVIGFPWVSAAGATVTAVSGFAIGLALVLRGRRDDLASTAPRLALALAGIALMLAMPLAVAWTVSLAMGSTFLDVDRMAATHGTLNAVAVLVASFSIGGSVLRRAPGV